VLLRALNVFMEDVVTKVHDSAPLRPKFIDVLKGMRESFAEFLCKSEDMEVTEMILGLVSHSVGLEGVETEQCREQEQEKEQEQEQEQEIEMERYVDMAYQRDGEEIKTWAFCTLGGGLETPQFYPANSFSLYGRNSLPFSQDLDISINHYDPKWVGDRRLKNAYVVLELIPDLVKLCPRISQATALSDASNARLQKALALLDVDNSGSFEIPELIEVLKSAEDIDLTEAELDELLLDSSKGGPRDTSLAVGASKRRTTLSFQELQTVLTQGKYRQQESGRRSVLLSLAEAETIRCILHLRHGKAPVEGCDAAMALRCVCANDIVLDASSNFVAGSRYQQSVAHNSFRFFNSETHYKPGDINILLREIPVEPVQRRFFFTAMVACRRRLAKRWEQTPLAKLFTFEDQWSMLNQRAQAVRMREAIRARGLLLQDAFQKFDWDHNGFLSMGELYGALEWLKLPGLTPQDVIFFMKHAGAEKTQLSYTEFIAMLLPDAAEGEDNLELLENSPADGSSAQNSAGAPRHKLTKEVSRVMPKCEDELRELLAQQVSTERKQEEALEKIEARQASLAHELLQSENADSFAWMQNFHFSQTKLTNPHTTRSAVMYDFGKGVEGTRRGAPLWIEGRGKWQLVIEGGVKCYKGWEDNYVVLRVPFRKNGSGMHLNQYSVSLYVKFRNADSGDLGLLSSQGWDQFSKPKENESVESALAFVTGRGGIGALGSFGEKRYVMNGTWHTITVTVDTVAGCMKTYCDAELVTTIQSGKFTRDGQFALRGRLALLFQNGAHSIFHLRSATVHSRVLSARMIASEHAMYQQLHILDAIQRAPPIHRASLSANHARQPYPSVVSMVAALTKLHVEIDDKASALWDLIQARDLLRLRSFLEDLAQDKAQAETFWTYASSWSKVTTRADQKNETVSPFGETLLHASAFAGHLDLVLHLVRQGANVNRQGKHSSCSALHSAAAAGDGESRCTYVN